MGMKLKKHTCATTRCKIEKKADTYLCPSLPRASEGLTGLRNGPEKYESRIFCFDCFILCFLLLFQYLLVLGNDREAINEGINDPLRDKTGRMRYSVGVRAVMYYFETTPETLQISLCL